MIQPSAGGPINPVVIDIEKPLFDTNGNLHRVILSSVSQLLTTFCGLFFVWDRISGESLMSGRMDDRLSNDSLPTGPSNLRVTDDDRGKMMHSAMIIDCLRRSSRAELIARARARRLEGPKSL